MPVGEGNVLDGIGLWNRNPISVASRLNHQLKRNKRVDEPKEHRRPDDLEGTDHSNHVGVRKETDVAARYRRRGEEGAGDHPAERALLQRRLS